MTHRQHILDLIVADKIETRLITDFSWRFIPTFLPEDKVSEIVDHGTRDFYGLVKKTKGDEASIFIPFYVKGIGYGSHEVPGFPGNFSDQELAGLLKRKLPLLHVDVQESNLPGLVLATERPFADAIKETFEELKYKVNTYERIKPA